MIGSFLFFIFTKWKEKTTDVISRRSYFCSCFQYFYKLPGLIYPGTMLLGVWVTQMTSTQHSLPGIDILKGELLAMVGEFYTETLEGQIWKYFGQRFQETLSQTIDVRADLGRMGAGIWGRGEWHLQKLTTKKGDGDFKGAQIFLWVRYEEYGGLWRGGKRRDWKINHDRIVKDLFAQLRR